MNRTPPPRLLPSVTTPLLTLYSAALVLALAATAPWWLRELRPAGKYREGFAERLGRIPRRRLHAPAAGEVTLWIHAVSVGEVLAAVPLVAALRSALPHARCYVSTTTRTGQQIARARFGADSVFYYPADFAFAVRAWLRFLRPSLVVLVESEFWPRFLIEAARTGVPVAVINARISDRSWPRYQRLAALWRPLLGTLSLVLAQSDRDAQRLRALGAPAASAIGNLKYDLPPPLPTPLLDQLRQAIQAGAPVLVCGSTLAGEEALLLPLLPEHTVTLLAPRHPERFDEVAALLQASGRPWSPLSLWRRDPQPIAPGTLLLLDSVGELAPLYALAQVAIVGGGFLHAGGHNPLEPASLGKPVVIGTGYANFLEIVTTLRAADAIRIAGLPEIQQTIAHLLADPAQAAALGERARAVCAASSGATSRVLSALLPLLQPQPALGTGA
ncbi:3-deoxy-D-manno-octulosonic acid transferase [Acidipila sp. EB88]|uniref:3-deoxy-D-manno-octulosonic acid transferase n=1 Tax=Acidipila sp. EB88 TaxID=2305226 RepID=UPI001F32A71A|nr:3-deoxy-D-manno-octulosonic acid transferase [Acidipila sp. EB88]